VEAIRSQGNMNKNLAYIIGVFLGDGTICYDKRTFGLQVIDKDFAEETAKSLKELSNNKIRLNEENRRTTANRIVYAVYLSDIELCNKLLEITNNRKNLPIEFEKWDYIFQKELIAGLLDSEGYVSMTKIHIYNNQTVFDMRIGIGATDTWLYELYKFCQTKNIKVGRLTREKLKSGKIFAKFIFNKKSFINNGLYFKIFRKQQRIENYKILFPGSTTKRSIPNTEETRIKKSLSKIGIKNPFYGKTHSEKHKEKLSLSANKRKRINGKFVKLGNDIV